MSWRRPERLKRHERPSRRAPRHDPHGHDPQPRAHPVDGRPLPGHMKRAAELFVIDEWGSDSGFVEKAWKSHSEPEPAFISIAVSHWQIVVTTQRDVTQLTFRGPET